MTIPIRPICLGCKHFRPDASTLTCDAFPDGIPKDIYESRSDHRRRHVGDNGIVFEPKSTKAADYADSLFKVPA